MTSPDTLNSRSIIFSLDPSNALTFKMEYQFDSIITEPCLALTETNGLLYGSTNLGGTNNHGYIFSFNLSNAQFTKEYNFNAKTDGGNFAGAWTLYNNKLYSTSNSGGINDQGTLVEFDLATKLLTVLEHQTVKNGRSIYGTPLVFNTVVSGINDIAKSPINNTVYPNPTTGLIQISGGNYDRIEVTNLQGQMVYQSNKAEVYNLSILQSGFYFVRVIDGKQVQTKKIVLE